MSGTILEDITFGEGSGLSMSGGIVNSVHANGADLSVSGGLIAEGLRTSNSNVHISGGEVIDSPTFVDWQVSFDRGVWQMSGGKVGIDRLAADHMVFSGAK